MVISAFFLKQKITALKVLGVMLGAAGAVMLLQLSTYDLSKQSSWQGDMCILINSLSFAVFLVMIKPMMLKYHPVTMMKWVFLFGLFFVVPFGYSEVSIIKWSDMSLPIWLGITYVLVGTTFVAYLLNIMALRQLSPSVVSFYIYLQPLLATLFAIIAGKNHPHILHFICAGLIFAGVYLVSRPATNQGSEKQIG